MDEREIDVTTGECTSLSANPRAEEIRAGIELTRAELDQTVNAIQAKLAPENIMNQAMQSMKSTASAASQAALDLVKENPLPSALIGAGLLWLAFNKTRGASGSSEGRARRSQHGLHRSARHASGHSGYDPYSDTARESPGVIGRAADKVKDAAETAADAVKDAAGTVTSKVSGYASTAGARAARLGGRAWEATGRARVAAAGTYDDYPLAIGAAAVAVSMAAGFALPVTRREREYLGPTRDRLMENVKARGAEAIERGEGAAKRALKDATDCAKSVAQNVTADAQGSPSDA